MSETNQKAQDTLRPIPPEERIMGPGSYFMMWLGGCINLGIFTVGSAQLEKGLNMMQIFLAMFIGTTVLVVVMCINDVFSYKTGAPYAIQLKSAYGTRGSYLPVLLRGLPGIVWYGFQSWLAGAAINNISIVVIGYDNPMLYFLLFQLIQIILSVKGFKGIKWVENVGGVVLTIAVLYMFYVCVTKYGHVMTELINQEPAWGMPFVAAIVAFFGNGALVLLNVGDYSREFKAGYSAWKRGGILFIPQVPITMLLGLIGFMSFAATGVANPINAFSMMVDNKVLLVITLLFILFAQLTTNLVSNVIPAVYALMDIAKMKHLIACIIVGIAGVCTCPWILTNDSSAAGLDLFVKIYSAFCAPILAVLLVDYYLLHKGNFTKEKLDDLYDDKGSRGGVNWAAIIATVIGAAIGIINVNIAFVTATIPTAVLYYFLTKKMKSCEKFRKGTIFEKQE
ncbi:MAG TPA: NCS1 family transporter [Candidatus Dorea faecigallinarum]|nr:NCS1 family transporter [Candidatus Dorea faecigallinarum]